jgi:threonine aldolase
MAAGRYPFASDNTSGAAPEALDALVEFNGGSASGYGTDHVTQQAADAVRGLLDADVDVRFLGSGTAANAICLATLCRPFEAVLAHRDAHVCTDETGAPGLFGHGLGLIHLDGPSGRIDPASLASALTLPDASYRQSPAALSLTNATEYGTVYTPDALKALTAQARARGLPVHLDGARLANALAAGFPPTALKDLGLDMLVIGGTKNGMTPTEALGAACWDARRWLGRPALADGAPADLLCFADDPRSGASVLSRPDRIVLRGSVFQPY